MTTRYPYGRHVVSQTTAMFILCLFFPASLPAGAMAQEPARPVAQEPAQEQSVPLSPIEQAEKKGTALPLSLKDLTKLALQNNLDIAISDTNEEMYRQKVIGSYGKYDPALNVGFGTTSSQSPNTNVATAAAGTNFNQFDRFYWNFSFLQNIPTGGAFQVDWNSGRNSTNQAFALFNPQYNASLLARVTQPLFRNRRTDEIRSNIKLVNLDLKINDSQFKQKVTDTIAQIQGFYWDLVAAIRDFEIKRESVKLAQIQLENNKKKVEIGTLAPIGITEARAEVASREQEMIASEEEIFTVQNGLRALISNDRHADIWHQTIVPTESPEFKQTKIDLDQAIETALQNRPELEQLATRLEKNEVSYKLDLNQKKWLFDLVGSFGSVGVAGPQSVACTVRGPGGTLPAPPNCVPPDPPGGRQTIDPIFIGGPATAYGLLFNGGFTNWAVGFNVQIPLKNREVESSLAQSRIEKRQMLMNRKGIEQKVIVDVRNAIQAIETNEKRVETAKVARDFAEQQLDGETKRFQAGLSENFRVLDRQRQLSVAQGVELQTLIAYKKSVIDLQKAMYTLLEFNDFEIAKTSSEQVPILK
jgi:outer membrane protein